MRLIHIIYSFHLAPSRSTKRTFLPSGTAGFCHSPLNSCTVTFLSTGAASTEFYTLKKSPTPLRATE